MKPTALEMELASCHTCQKVSSMKRHHCPRCGTPLHARKEDSISRSVAFGLAGILAFIPANIFPIMLVTQFGAEEDTTILGGVATFWASGAYPVAIIIFVASIMIPGLKFLSIAILCAAATGKITINPKRANTLYFLTELVGRWSMVDVFVVAILVGLIQMGNLMSIEPGGAAIAFGIMVVLTMISAHSFDPKLIWDRLRENQNTPPSP